MEAWVTPAVQELDFFWDDGVSNHSSNCMLNLLHPWNANSESYWKAKIHHGSVNLLD